MADNILLTATKIQIVIFKLFFSFILQNQTTVLYSIVIISAEMVCHFITFITRIFVVISNLPTSKYI